MSAKYLIRFDDICPTMNWKLWHDFETVLIEEDIKPILAVIPDNKDERLYVGERDERFWERVRGWQARGWTIGLHGHQHRYVTGDCGIFGLQNSSEFAGLSPEDQKAKLRKAVEIFTREGVRPDVWIAPAHSFDANTIEALNSVGIRSINDGFHLFPYVDPGGMLWVPQQIWRFRPMPVGIWTVSIHLNDELYGDVALFRRSIKKYKHAVTSFPIVSKAYSHRRRSCVDTTFSSLLRFGIRCRAIVQSKVKLAECRSSVLSSDSSFNCKPSGPTGANRVKSSIRQLGRQLSPPAKPARCTAQGCLDLHQVTDEKESPQMPSDHELVSRHKGAITPNGIS